MQRLTCILMDYDDFNPDDEIGRCELPIKDISEETQDIWLDVDMNAEGDEDNNQKVGQNNLTFFQRLLGFTAIQQ